MSDLDSLTNLNREVSEILKAYLDYCGRIVSAAVSSQGYHLDKFRQISDELVITPEEIVQLVDRIQIALSRV
ncbi:MAG: hypothetical protein AB1665_00060 [Candidatus Thermoplasmatota archaeon]